MRSFIYILFFLLLSLSSQAQDITFTLLFNKEILMLDRAYQYKNQPVTFSKLKFYVSNIKLMKNKKLVKKLDWYFLFDATDVSVFKLVNKDVPVDFDEVRFSIGVDSTKSVSGAFGESLDPTKGMYWSWQSGYINCKIEGTSPLCPSRKNKFQFHLGGYASPYNALRKYSVACTPSGEQTVAIDIKHFMDGIDLAKDYQIMSPGKKAMTLSDLFLQCFRTHEE